MAIPRLSRPALAQRIGVDPGTLGNIERGYRNLGGGEIRKVEGDPVVIAKAARALGVSPERMESEGQSPAAAAALRSMLRGEGAPPRPALVPPLPTGRLADMSDEEIERTIATIEPASRRRIAELAWAYPDPEHFGRLKPRGQRIELLEAYLGPAPGAPAEEEKPRARGEAG
jgi:transcriptional regulator with XRE-family HTH domain